MDSAMWEDIISSCEDNMSVGHANSDISDIYIKSKYQYIRRNQYFHPCSNLRHPCSFFFSFFFLFPFFLFYFFGSIPCSCLNLLKTFSCNMGIYPCVVQFCGSIEMVFY